jgi:hypothetical protein
MESGFMIQSVGSCVDWLIALAVIGAGAVAVRKAEPRAGYLVLATGVIWLLSTCCAIVPDVQMRVLHSPPGVLLMLCNWLSVLLYAAGLAALAGAAVVMARSLIALGGGGK